MMVDGTELIRSPSAGWASLIPKMLDEAGHVYKQLRGSEGEAVAPQPHIALYLSEPLRGREAPVPRGLWLGH